MKPWERYQTQQVPEEGPWTKFQQAPRSDSMLDDALDAGGELAAGANRSAMFIPDNVVEAVNSISGGYAGLLKLLTGQGLDAAADAARNPPLDIPTPSEGIEALTGRRPGQGGYMEPGMARDAVSAAGEVLVPGAAGLKAVQGRNLATVPGAAAEFAGFGSASPASQLPGAVEATQEVIARNKAPRGLRRYPAPPEDKFAGASRRDLAVRRGAGDADGAGYRLGHDGTTVKDRAQQRALRAGLDEGIVAQVASGSPADKKRMAEMLDILEQGRRNKTFQDFNSPRLALGDTLMDRYKTIKEVNWQAGKALGEATEQLKRVPADIEGLQQGPVRNFLESLRDIGVRMDRQGGVYFKGSDLEGIPEAQGIIDALVKRTYDTNVGSAYNLHRIKKFIDEQVNYGESAKGLKGSAINIMKSLRHDMNEFLKARHPEYARANEVYSDTIQVLNDAQELTGRKNVISDRELGRIARQGLSNAQRSGRVQDLLEQMDEVAKRYGGQFSDDLQRQTSFVQTLEKLFNVSPPASFKGDISKAVDQAVEAGMAAAGDAAPLASMVTRGVKKVFGKSDIQREEELLKALRELISGDGGS